MPALRRRSSNPRRGRAPDRCPKARSKALRWAAVQAAQPARRETNTWHQLSRRRQRHGKTTPPRPRSPAAPPCARTRGTTSGRHERRGLPDHVYSHRLQHAACEAPEPRVAVNDRHAVHDSLVLACHGRARENPEIACVSGISSSRPAARRTYCRTSTASLRRRCPPPDPHPRGPRRGLVRQTLPAHILASDGRPDDAYFRTEHNCRRAGSRSD
jgi:hypothetical protein